MAKDAKGAKGAKAGGGRADAPFLRWGAFGGQGEEPAPIGRLFLAGDNAFGFARRDERAEGDALGAGFLFQLFCGAGAAGEGLAQPLAGVVEGGAGLGGFGGGLEEGGGGERGFASPRRRG
jgi:hypothetical protein